MIELIMNYIVRNEGRDSPLSVYRGIVLAIVMMFLIPSLFQFGHQISTSLTDSVISVSGMSSSSTAESKISNAIVKSMVYTNETKSENITNIVNNWKTIDINDTEGGFAGFGDCYKYSVNFFMLIILAIQLSVGMEHPPTMTSIWVEALAPVAPFIVTQATVILWI